MPNAALAQKILDAIELDEAMFNMATWAAPLCDDEGDVLPGFKEALKPDDNPVDCGTTLCVAGWAMHFTGWTLFPSAATVSRPVHSSGRFGDGHEIEGREALGITKYDAGILFYVSEDEAKDALKQLADGAEEIDWSVIRDEEDEEEYDEEDDY